MKYAYITSKCPEMNRQLTEALTNLGEKLVPVKVICAHSKPWVTRELSDQLKKQRQVKRKWKRRRTPRNYTEYQEVLKETEQMIDAAKHDWWENEVGKLNTVSQADKWKIN